LEENFSVSDRIDEFKSVGLRSDVKGYETIDRTGEGGGIDF